MSNLMGNLIDTKIKASWKMMEDWQNTIYSMMVFGATMVVMFWASVFLYTSFYFTYMPQESITWPIHLQYKSCGDLPGICSFPNSLVSVTDPSRGSLLARGQKYRVVVDLEMPESPTNQKSGTGLSQMSGMFLITMEMRSFTGDVLRKNSRSSMLRYKSQFLQAMSTFIFAPFLLYGAHEEKQLVTAELFTQYEEDPVTPLSDVYIEIGSRNIEVYSAQLRIHATFAGLRHFMYYYPLTAAVFGIGVCMVFLSLIVLFSWYQFSMPAEKMTLGPGGHPNGHLTVEDISKEGFEKDAKEGTDDSRRTSSASETSYSPAQMETDTKVEGSGWTSFFTRRPSSTNDDARENDTSRRTSSHNVAAFVARPRKSSNVSCSSSRRSSIKNDDTLQDTSKKRKPSFFESIAGVLSTPANTNDDIQNITIEVPSVRSRHSSDVSAKVDSTSKRSSWILSGDNSDKEVSNDQSSWLFGNDVDEKKESATNGENTKKELESRKSSWRSSWFGGDIDTADTDDKPENEKYASSKHSSRRTSLHSHETQEELLQQTEDISGKDTSTSKRSSWRSSWFGGDIDTDDKTDNEKYTSSKHSSRRTSLHSHETQEELIQQTEDFSGKDTSTSKRSSWRSSWFGGELQDEPAEQSEESGSKEEGSISKRSSWFGGDSNVKDADEDENSMEDGSLKKSANERKPSFIETMFGISINTEEANKLSRRSSTRDDIVDNALELEENHSQQSSVSASHDVVLEVPKIQASSRRSSAGSFKGNTENQGYTSMPGSSHVSTHQGDNLGATTSVDHTSPTGSRRSSTFVDSLENLSGERRPSFLESMIKVMINPKDTSSQQSSTEREIDNMLEVSDSNSRRSSRGLIRDNIRHESNNENYELQVDDTRRSSRRSSRGSTREDALEVPIIKTSSRRSSTGSVRGDTSEDSGRHSPRDVAINDATRLLEDANLVIRRRSSLKDSSIKRVSYLLDEGSSSTRRRSSTSESTLNPSDTDGNLYPSTVDVNTRRKSSTSFIKYLITEPSDNDEVKIQKTSRPTSRNESLQRKSSTTPLTLDPTGDEFTAKHSRSPSVSSDRSEMVHRLSQSSSPVTRVHEDDHSEDKPRPVSGRLSYLFQESETENLAPSSGVTAERRPSFIESMMGILVAGVGTTSQNGEDNKEDEKE